LSAPNNGVADPNTIRIIFAALRAAAGEVPHVHINGDGSAVREFTHVRDVAEAFRLALDAPAPGTHQVLNLGTGQGLAMRDIIRASGKITDRPIPVTHGPAAHEAHTLVADGARIRHTLRWNPMYSAIERIIRDAWNARSR
jgi:UDP-glucose 4-epimerase